MKPYYIEEARKTARDVLGAPGDFAFAVVTDSHLDDNIPDTMENIAWVDAQANFDCLVHMGDMLNGLLPGKISAQLYKEQIMGFRSAVRGGFYPVQGNHDGYAEEGGGDILSDYLIQNTAGHLRADLRVHQPGVRPYYYVDFPDRRIRLIILATFMSEYADGGWKQTAGIDPAQADWLRDTALDLDGSWTVLLFSHDAPFREFSSAAVSAGGRWHSGRALQALIDRRAERGFSVAAWFVGHFHGDWAGDICGVNFVLVGSATAYVPQLWGMPQGGGFAPRTPGSMSEDLWDAAVLDQRTRKLRLFRFGAGSDRTIDY